jgi:predicted amidophosphoribosyltransferase
MTTEAHCPICESAELSKAADGSLRCPACGVRFSADGILCPGCGASNAFHLDRCKYCGEPLTSFGRALSRQGAGRRPYKLDQVRLTSARIRAQEEQASQERLGALEEIDNLRIQQEAKAAQAAAARDRKLFRVVFVASGIFLILVVLIVLLLTSP